MGSKKKRPADYRPLLELNLRRKVEGGSLRVPGSLIAVASAGGRDATLLLVHGFNNNEGEAARAYVGFRSRQNTLQQPPDPTTFERYFGDVFWPGDGDFFAFLDTLDFLVYPSAVHNAVTAGKELANMLDRLPNLRRLDLIGHSLGCRVILEALRVMRQRTLPVVGRVCLMAAAVPSEMLEPGGRFHDLLVELAAEGTRIHVLHSKQDPVLHLAFPPGQLGAGVSEASTRALGRFGPVATMPGFAATLTEREMTGAGHGDYWGHSGSSVSRAATEEAGSFLALGDAVREIGRVRDLGVSSSLAPMREAATVREIGES